FGILVLILLEPDLALHLRQLHEIIIRKIQLYLHGLQIWLLNLCIILSCPLGNIRFGYLSRLLLSFRSSLGLLPASGKRSRKHKYSSSHNKLFQNDSPSLLQSIPASLVSVTSLNTL